MTTKTNSYSHRAADDRFAAGLLERNGETEAGKTREGQSS